MDDTPALTDRALDHALQTELDKLAKLRNRPGWLFWRRRRKQRRHAKLERIRHILSVYPWQEYPYRYGRWQRTQRIIDLGFPSFKWARTYDTFQLLDPTTGRPVAELTATDFTLPAPAGTLRFAGDPHTAGVYTPPGGTTADLRLALSAFADQDTAFAEALHIRPGSTATHGSERFNQQLLADDDRRPWIADQPTPPPNR
jgi:hypothetical protein